MWDVVLDGPFVPMKTGTGGEASVPKLRSEWSESKVKRVQVNFKAINTLHCALNSIEFNRISTCKTAKEIWDKLRSLMKKPPKLKNQRLLSSQINMKCSRCKQMRVLHLGLIDVQLL